MRWLHRLRVWLGLPPEGRGVRGRARWVEAGASPFGVEVLDCTPVTQEAVAMAVDAEAAERWLRLRRSDGREHRGRSPQDASTTACRLAYRQPQRPPEGPVFKAEVMEDRWDVFHWDGRLHFVRSWSGTLVYRARVEWEDGRMHVAELEYPGGESPELAVREVDFLVRSHLFDELAPHPLPPGGSEDPQELAQASFARFGRRCRFGSFADTTRLPAIGDERFAG